MEKLNHAINGEPKYEPEPLEIGTTDRKSYGISREWPEIKRQLDSLNLPYQRRITGSLVDFITNNNDMFDKIVKEPYFAGTFYFKLISKSPGMAQPEFDKIFDVGAQAIINFANSITQPELYNFEFTAYVKPILGANIIKRDRHAYIEMSAANGRVGGLDIVKHHYVDMVITADEDQITSIRHLTNNVPEGFVDLQNILGQALQYLKPQYKIQYKPGDDRGIETAPKAYYYETIFYQNPKQENQILFLDVTDNPNFIPPNTRTY
jgi:hypothetical protein